jgi:predicted RNase H-like HicB family nuclease
MKTYHLIVFEAEEGGYWGEVAELPGCVAQGETLDDLKRNTINAIDVFLEVMEAEGEEPSGDRYIANFELAST